MSISPTQDDVMTVLRSFLLDRLPGVEVIQGIENRVAEPTSPNFALMTLIRSIRLATNIDTDQDVKFTGTIAPGSASFTASIEPAPRAPGAPPSGILTVTGVGSGQLIPGALLAAAGLPAGVLITSQIDGSPGGIGNYAVTAPLEMLSSAFTASYGLMTVSAVAKGQIVQGANVFGVGVTIPTAITALGTGTGGTGTYIVQPSQTFASGTLSAGGRTIREKSSFTYQIDFHSADPAPAADMAQTISATFRDPYAVDFIGSASGGTMSPLYADTPRFAPFQNENQQFEYRWILEANLQVDQVTRVPAQYADLASIVVISVDTGPPYP